MTEQSITPADVVAFWREAGEKKWFRKDDAFDRAIAGRFTALHNAAAAGKLSDWRETAEGALALVLVLDQFSRNLFRGSPKTFAQDAMAVEEARRAVDAGFDTEVDANLRFFFYMPFMHSEALADQERCIELLSASGAEGLLKYAHEHCDIIRRFGRFPHRNAVLGRQTTPAERTFLEEGGFAG